VFLVSSVVAGFVVSFVVNLLNGREYGDQVFIIVLWIAQLSVAGMYSFRSLYLCLQSLPLFLAGLYVYVVCIPEYALASTHVLSWGTQNDAVGGGAQLQKDTLMKRFQAISHRLTTFYIVGNIALAFVLREGLFVAMGTTLKFVTATIFLPGLMNMMLAIVNRVVWWCAGCGWCGLASVLGGGGRGAGAGAGPSGAGRRGAAGAGAGQTPGVGAASRYQSF
jgi:hypothetical protein